VRFSPTAQPANCNGAADFPAVKRPFNESDPRHLSTAFRPPTTPLRFFALQRFRPGRSTYFAGFTCPLWSVLRVWSPSRRFSPGPTLPALFQTGCAPGLYPSEVAHACGGTAFLPLRADRVVSSPSAGSCKHVRTAGSATSRVWPARVPVARLRVLPRTLARASPGFLLSGVCPSTGVACSSANLRPLTCPPSGYPAGSALSLGVFTADRPSSSAKSAGQSRQTPDLATGGGPRYPCEVYAPSHDSAAEGCPDGLA
jgi:hypothetical protein